LDQHAERSIYFPIDPNDTSDFGDERRPNPKIPDKPHDEWKKDHPPIGVWPLKSVLKLLVDPRLGEPGAFVLLRVEEDDRMSDVLACMSSIKMSVGSKVLPELTTSRKKTVK
jgi:hypothetical protein